MPYCLDYAKIACAAYFDTNSQYYQEPPGHMVDAWKVDNWTRGGLFGSGMQGGLWMNDSDVVVGICGTNLGQKGKLVHDLGADLKLALGGRPNGQCDAAKRLVAAARQVAGGRRISMTGHSLGGGIAQVVGFEEGVRFVTFNAPPMLQVSQRAGKAGYSDPSLGVNFRVNYDPVSTAWILGKHIGMVIDLDSTVKGGSKHAGTTIWQVMLDSAFSHVDGYSGKF